MNAFLSILINIDYGIVHKKNIFTSRLSLSLSLSLKYRVGPALARHYLRVLSSFIYTLEIFDFTYFV